VKITTYLHIVPNCRISGAVNSTRAPSKCVHGPLHVSIFGFRDTRPSQFSNTSNLISQINIKDKFLSGLVHATRIVHFSEQYVCCTWAGSSVVTATDYGLDGPGSNPGGDKIFRPSRPALGPTQPPVQWAPGFAGGKGGRGGGVGLIPPTPSSAAVMERVKLYLYLP